MTPLVLRIIEIVAVVGTVASWSYFLLCSYSAAVFLRRKNLDTPSELPPVSILKPLKGVDPEIYESFRSHCLQDYPQYEIIFGVSDPDDPATASVQQLQREFPDRAIRLAVCPKILGANVKVSNLVQMLPHAQYDFLLVNDSDIRVEPGYLHRIMAPLADANTGMVTCLYRGIAAPTLGSKLEALGISTDFAAGVLAANALEGGIHFGLGSTLAFRRTDLARIGGFEAILDYLADDYELGHRIAASGKRVHLAEVVVETHVPTYNLAGYFSHQLRWSRGIRDSRPGGYFGLIFTFGLMWSIIAVAFSAGATWAWELFGATLALRYLQAWTVGHSVLRDRQLLTQLWLLPLRDFFGVAIWVASFAGHTVTWRGTRFLLKRGKLIRMKR